LKTRNKKNTTNGSKPGASITSHFYQNLSGPAPELIGGTLPPSPNPTAIRVYWSQVGYTTHNLPTYPMNTIVQSKLRRVVGTN